MKFQQGDRVRVRSDLIPGQHYNSLYFPYDMSRHRGKVYTVFYVTTDGSYKLTGAEGWFFNDEMLTPDVTVQEKAEV